MSKAGKKLPVGVEAFGKLIGDGYYYLNIAYGISFEGKVCCVKVRQL